MFVKSGSGSAESGGGSTGVDLCFILDLTGSMGSWIAAAKQQITGIAKNVKKVLKEKQNKVVVPRVSFVGYRDIGDGTGNTEVWKEFTEDIDSVCNYVNTQGASGGADTPEDMAGGFWRALKLNWESQARFVILITDAPCHGTEYHTCGDDYPGGDPNGRDPKKQLVEMREKNIHFMITALNSTCEKMIKIFETAYNDSSGDIDFSLTRLTSSGDPRACIDAFIDQVAGKVTHTIMHDFM